MPPRDVLHASACGLRLDDDTGAELRIVGATPLPHDLDPLHRCCHCGCHTGSLIPATHASKETQASSPGKGGQGRTHTLHEHEGDFDQLAQQAKLSRTYTARLLRLSWLSLEVTLAILQGRQPPKLTADRLSRMARIPIEWQAQRASLGWT